jgi:hypothetical protein
VKTLETNQFLVKKAGTTRTFPDSLGEGRGEQRLAEIVET